MDTLNTNLGELVKEEIRKSKTLVEVQTVQEGEETGQVDKDDILGFLDSCVVSSNNKIVSEAVIDKGIPLQLRQYLSTPTVNRKKIQILLWYGRL